MTKANDWAIAKMDGGLCCFGAASVAEEPSEGITHSALSEDHLSGTRPPNEVGY